MRSLIVLVVAFFIRVEARHAYGEELRPSQQTAIADVDSRSDELKAVNQAIWKFAEVGLDEHQSASLLVSKLKQNGFDVKNAVSDMPTAFVASFGSGKPIIGILAEYDALPGMSQQIEPERLPLTEGAAGHACGHSGLGTGALGAVLAVKAAMEKHKLNGTIRLYGTPAEETVIGKVYMLLDGQFDDLDVCLHWHPSTKTGAWAGSSKAVVSAKFTFDGVSAHAAGNPEKGRSALDAVELMNIGSNFMREHTKEDARIHYVITDGGGAPNVVPPKATAWYFVRADTHEDVEYYFNWVRDIAEGAAKMTRTKLKVHVDTDCHELISNSPLSELLHANLTRIGPPTFTDAERAFARRIQQPLVEEFGTTFPEAIAGEINSLEESYKPSKGSTDVGDISWYVPTGGIRTTCMAAESPGHSWQNVACIGSTIGEKGIDYAARVLAISALDLFEKPELVLAARADWKQRMADRKYTSLIPKGQKPPVAIR
ncbi:MAG: amidohydrolase [Planctomycetota bacterium]|nr:amidohydrolase [Planctomycetota bacterium]MDA1166465.1 amidohydrolase [Planctomycetota bacterium]